VQYDDPSTAGQASWQSGVEPVILPPKFFRQFSRALIKDSRKFCGMNAAKLASIRGSLLPKTKKSCPHHKNWIEKGSAINRR
jgi:hypothetical protein